MTGGGLYRVIGSRRYREFQPGDLFEAKLDPGAEARAIGRGDIELVERIQFTVQPGSYQLPRKEQSDGEANRASRLRRG